jgi:hypothetical protein
MSLLQKIQYKKEQKKKAKKQAENARTTLEKMREQFNFVTDLMVKRPEYWQDRHRERQKIKDEYRTKRMEALPAIAKVDRNEIEFIEPGVKRGRAFFTPKPRAGISFQSPKISLKTKIKEPDREFTKELVNCYHSDSESSVHLSTDAFTQK